MQQLIQIQPWLNAQARNIVIIPHQRPDADALGSGLALFHWFQAEGHRATVVSPTPFPAFLNWMSGSEAVIVYSEREKAARKALQSAELIVCVDFSGLSRIEPLDKLIRERRAELKIALIDHHRGKEDFADYECWDIKAAATAELVFDFIREAGAGEQMTATIASLLYAGVMTDTGSFKHSNTTPKVHRLVADLMECGADHGRIQRAIFDNNTENRTRFLGYALSQRLTVLPEYHAAYFAISESDLKRFSSQNGDTEGLVNYALSIQGICLAATFIERDGEIRISLRSVGEFSVADMAEAHFNGGGHQNASGGRFRDRKLTEAVDHFVNLLPRYQSALEKAYHTENSKLSS